MSLSASTLALFVFLAPGLIFRATVFWMSPVRRPFGANTIYSSIAVILVAVAIHLVLALLALLLEAIVRFFNPQAELPQIVDVGGAVHIKWFGSSAPIAQFVLDNFFVFFAYFVAVSLLALALAWGVRFVADRSRNIGRALYGPLSEMLSVRNTPVITCFILTKVQHENRRLVYSGWPQEISLGDTNNIDHVILRDPEKFYLRLNDTQPTTSHKRSRPISSRGNGASYLYVEKAQIENVHFEAYYFDGKG